MAVKKDELASYLMFGLIADMAQLGRAFSRKDKRRQAANLDQMIDKLKQLRKAI